MDTYRTHTYTVKKGKTGKNIITKDNNLQNKTKQLVKSMLALSSRPKQRHRQRESHMHSTVARRIAKARQARIQKILSANDLPHHKNNKNQKRSSLPTSNTINRETEGNEMSPLSN